MMAHQLFRRVKILVQCRTSSVSSYKSRGRAVTRRSASCTLAAGGGGATQSAVALGACRGV
jgi:hypothetical protein